MKIAKVAEVQFYGMSGSVLRWSDGSVEIRAGGDSWDSTIRLHLDPSHAAKVAELFAEGVLEELVAEVDESNRKVAAMHIGDPSEKNPQ
jgi:hypothetical protein